MARPNKRGNHRHAFAVVEYRYNWIAGRPQLRVLSTHKTGTAADRATPAPTKHQPILVNRSQHFDGAPLREWWPA